MEKLLHWEGIIEKNFATRHELELKNMLAVSRIIVKAALTRKGSVGAHYRSDYKERGKNWQQHVPWNKRTFDFRADTQGNTQGTKTGTCN